MLLSVWKTSCTKALLAVLILWGGCIAAIEVAKIDRNVWVYPLDSPASFDFASKMEMLIFASHLESLRMRDDETLATYIQPHTKVANPRIDSVRMYMARMQAKILANFEAITKSENPRLAYDFLPPLPSKPMQWSDIVTLSEYARTHLPADLQKWRAQADMFYTHYLNEQIRLSALFPRITSEILPLGTNQNIEIIGDTLKDKSFILTFDDGPTPKGGNTDRLITLLESLNLQAIFFVLGENLHKRGDVSKLYANMVVGYHGDVHTPHTKPEIYHNAPTQSRQVATLGSEATRSKCYFRPPYGQRTLGLLQVLEQTDCKVVLWNIDSQDWTNLSSHEILDRILTLSLLWRSGIILFHDVHTKSYEILPQFTHILHQCDVELGDFTL